MQAILLLECIFCKAEKGKEEEKKHQASSGVDAKRARSVGHAKRGHERGLHGRSGQARRAKPQANNYAESDIQKGYI